MKKPLALCLQTLAVVLLSARLVVADGVECDSVEATSGGRGGTNIAQSDNGAVLLSNPAAIFNVDGDGLVEFGANGLITDLHYENPINDDTAAHTRPIALPMFSYIQKVPDSNWAFGLGVFAPAGFAAGWDLNNNVEGNQSYKSFGSLIKVLPAVSYRVLPGLTIGATLGVANSLHRPRHAIQHSDRSASPERRSIWNCGAMALLRPGRSVCSTSSHPPRRSVFPTRARTASISTGTCKRPSSPRHRFRRNSIRG